MNPVGSELKLLIGPLFNPQVLGSYQYDPNIKIFASEPYLPQFANCYAFTYRFSAQLKFQDLLTKLPPDWHPDWVIWWDLVYQALPPGIEDCPYPTAVIPGDWNLSFLNVRDYIEAFDYVLCDRHLGTLLYNLGYRHGVEWKSFSFEPERFQPPTHEERFYDIAFIGNMNPVIHPERNRYLRMIQHLHGEYNVFMGHQIVGDAYVHLLQQSKIVFNYTICQVLNMRAYEAPACGALLFIEENNLEIRDILSDQSSCVLYNAHNLDAKLRYYLEHPDERQRIAHQGYQLIQGHSYAKQFAALLQRLKQLPRPNQNRLFQSQTDMHKDLVRTRQMHFATTLDASHTAYELLSTTLPNQLETNPWFTLAKATYILAQHKTDLKQPIPVASARHAVRQAIRWLHDLPDRFKQHPVIASNLGWAYQLLNEVSAAQQHYRHALDLLKKETSIDWAFAKKWVQPTLFERTTDVFPIYWERIGYTISVPQQDLAYRQLLKCHCHKQLGYLAETVQEWESAGAHYQAALLFEPYQIEVWYYLARLAFQQQQDRKGWRAVQQLIQHNGWMVESLSTLIPPRLLLTYADELMAWLKPYLATFHSDYPQVQVKYGQTQAFYQVIHLAQQITETIESLSPSTLWQHLWDLSLTMTVTPHLEHVLRICRQNPDLTPLTDIMMRPIHLYWHSHINEPAWLVEQISNPVPEAWSWLIQSEYVATPSQGCYYRSHDQPTDLNTGILGPDRWPWCFAPVSQEQPVALLGNRGQEQRLLFFAEDLGHAHVQQWMKQLFCADLQTPLWCIFCHLGEAPAPSPEFLQDLEIAEHIELVWLENMSQSEYLHLLQEVDWVLGLPQSNSHYLLWWALWLGLPIGFLSLPAFNPYLCVLSEAEWHSLYMPTPLSDWTVNTPAYHGRKECHKQLRFFDKHHAADVLLNTCWQMRLIWFKQEGHHEVGT